MFRRFLRHTNKPKDLTISTPFNVKHHTKNPESPTMYLIPIKPDTNSKSPASEFIEMICMEALVDEINENENENDHLQSQSLKDNDKDKDKDNDKQSDHKSLYSEFETNTLKSSEWRQVYMPLFVSPTPKRPLSKVYFSQMLEQLDKTLEKVKMQEFNDLIKEYEEPIVSC